MNIDVLIKKMLEELDELNEQDIQRISLIINDFKERLYYQLKSLNLDIKSTYSLVNDFLVSNITKSFLSANDDINDIISDIINSTKDVVVVSDKNKITNIKSFEKIKKVYSSKINELDLFTDTFNKLYEQNIEIFIYKLSINNNLGNKPIVYTSVNSLINENKKDLINEFDKVINNKKKYSLELYDKYIEVYINRLIDKKNEIKDNNYKMIVDYANDLLNNKFDDNINKYLKNNYDFITNNLKECHKNILKTKKLKDCKTNDIILNSLLEYLYGYNNTLFDKVSISVKKMIKIISYENEVTHKKLKDYNDNIYKIFNLEFNFDKQFDEYKNKLLSKRSFSNTDKIIVDVLDIVSKCREDIISLIKNNLTLCFKDCMNDLNEIVIKTMSVKLKCKNLDIKITSSVLKEMYK